MAVHDASRANLLSWKDAMEISALKARTKFQRSAMASCQESELTLINFWKHREELRRARHSAAAKKFDALYLQATVTVGLHYKPTRNFNGPVSIHAQIP
jgi:hypothetical protein